MELISKHKQKEFLYKCEDIIGFQNGLSRQETQASWVINTIEEENY